MGLRTFVIWAGLVGGLLLAGPARAQAPDTAGAAPAEWRLYVDGASEAWPPSAAYPADSLEAAVRLALGALQEEGYYFARLDSARLDPPAVHLYTTRGPEVRIGRVHLDGVAAADTAALLRQMETRPGQTLSRPRLEADVAMLLAHYEAAGYPLAQVTVDDLRLLPGDPPRLAVVLRVAPGRVLTLARIELDGAGRTRPAFVRRLAELRTGAPLTAYDPAEIRRRLEGTGFFEEVGDPVLLVAEDSAAVLRIPLTDGDPGTFDLVLGYLPSSGAGQPGSVVGNGHLSLRNLFGRGRSLGLRLNRMPGQVSSVDVRAADPFLFGLPLRVEGRFEGLQQDSTFGKQRYRAEVGYRMGGGLEAFTTFSRERTRPGQGGVQLVGGRQRIPQATARFLGLGVRVQRLDRAVNPGRGFYLETNLEQGRKEQSARLVTGADTTLQRTVLAQKRLQAEGRLYVPTLARQVLVLGADAAVLLSNSYDRSDLFRFGGATTLRGYDEERFLGRFVTRALAEYRYRLDRQSYAFLFVDLGYVDTPATVDLEAAHGWHPGYGLGIQFSTALGLVNVSAALNPEDGPTGARIHAGLSFGL